jgi:hypothetical protein
LPRDLELLGGRQAGAGRLLAVAQRRVEDADAARGHERRRGTGNWRAHGLLPDAAGAAGAADVAAAWAWPA